MQSNKSLAVWASQTYQQGSGENNWSQYQLSLTGTSAKFNIYSTNNSSTVFSYYANVQGNSVSSGDTLLLSTNGSTFVSGTAGAVTTTSQTVSAPGAFSLSTGSIPIGFGPQSYITPDGLTLFTSAYNNSTVYVYQYSLSTAFDITTATYTNKYFAGTYFGIGYGYGFTMKPDGSTLYVISGSVVKSYVMTTAFDISTASTTPTGTVTLTMPLITGNWNNGVGYNALRISQDGTKLVACNTAAAAYNNGSPYNNFGVYTMSVPWVLGSCTTTTTNYTNAALYYNSPYWFCDFNLTPDGTGIILGTGNYGGYNCSTSYMGMIYINMSTPYNLTTATFSNWTNSNGGTSSTGNLYFIWFVNATGTSISMYTNRSYRGTSAINFYRKYNVDVSSFGLGSAATAGYLPAPTVKVSAETTAARVNLFDYQVYMASSSTTQAVVYKPAAGYIAANDTLSLNGTTSVTVSAVTEGATGGVAAIPTYTAANRTYAGKSLTLMAGGARSIGNFVMSPDGTRFICGLMDGTYGAGIYAYNLTTPFDISTATFANSYIPITPDVASYFAGYGAYCDVAFDISPDGTRLITLGCYVTGSDSANAQLTARDYALYQAWNIGTINYTGSKWQVGPTSTYVSNSTCPTGIRFTPNGSQVVACFNNQIGAADTSWIAYQACGTAYRIGTAATGSTIWFNASASSAMWTTIFTPDGLNITTFQRSGISTSNTLGTANNMATATKTNNPSSSAIKWTWPSGTVVSSTWPAGGYYSPDGTKLYTTANVDYSPTTVWQMNVMVIPQTSYTCTFPTQGSAPTSVVVPDRSVAQTITTTLSGGNMTFAASAVGTNARGIAMKITSPKAYTTITNATLSMWKS